MPRGHAVPPVERGHRAQTFCTRASADVSLPRFGGVDVAMGIGGDGVDTVEPARLAAASPTLASDWRRRARISDVCAFRALLETASTIGLARFRGRTSGNAPGPGRHCTAGCDREADKLRSFLWMGGASAGD